MAHPGLVMVCKRTTPTVLVAAWVVCILGTRVAAYHVAGGWWDPREEEFIVQRRRQSQLVIEQNTSIGALLDDYMEHAQKGKQVQGYLELQALMTFRVLAANQLEMGVVGGVAEIGVHHGMSFAPLCLLNADAGAMSPCSPAAVQHVVDCHDS